jgi:FdhE protein
LNDPRLSRARVLAERHPASREVLELYASVVELQARIGPRVTARASLCGFLGELLEAIAEKAPPLLREAAQSLHHQGVCREALEAYWRCEDTESPRSFFARVLLGAWARAAPGELEKSAVRQGSQARCPRCGQLPQAAVLRPVGEGSALTLVCSLCGNEWPHPRGRCPVCGAGEERLSFHTAASFAHVTLAMCDACRRYLHTVDLGKDPEAVPEIDELAALPLDVWAREQGFRKLQVNLAGV